MVSTKLLKQMMLGLAVIGTPFMLASCSDDDGGGGPSLEAGTVNAEVSGSVNLNLSKGKASFTQNTTNNPISGNKVTTLTVNWQGPTPGNSISLELTNADGSDIPTKTYTPIDNAVFQTQIRYLKSSTVMIDSVEYDFEEEGSVKVKTKTDSEVIGKFNNLKYQEGFAGDTLTLNGDFHAQSN